MSISSMMTTAYNAIVSQNEFAARDSNASYKTQGFTIGLNILEVGSRVVKTIAGLFVFAIVAMQSKMGKEGADTELARIKASLGFNSGYNYVMATAQSTIDMISAKFKGEKAVEAKPVVSSPEVGNETQTLSQTDYL